MLLTALQRIQEQLPGLCQEYKLNAEYALTYARVTEAAGYLAPIYVNVGATRDDAYRFIFTSEGNLSEIHSITWDGSQDVHTKIAHKCGDVDYLVPSTVIGKRQTYTPVRRSQGGGFPISWQIKLIDKRWRRVYVTSYNSGLAYVRFDGKRLFLGNLDPSDK